MIYITLATSSSTVEITAKFALAPACYRS